MRDHARSLGLELRAGLHTGEIERRADDISGLAVHLASRVQSVAEPGEVVVSSTVVDLTIGSGLEYEPRGDRRRPQGLRPHLLTLYSAVSVSEPVEPRGVAGEDQMRSWGDTPDIDAWIVRHEYGQSALMCG